MPRGKTIRTDRARAAFLAVLAEHCNVSEACRAARISRSAAYEWRNDDPAFAAAWDDAEQTAADTLEKVAWDRATAKKGWSDRMLEILLKAHRPEKFVEKQNIKVETVSVVEVLKDANARVRHGRTPRS